MINIENIFDNQRMYPKMIAEFFEVSGSIKAFNDDPVG